MTFLENIENIIAKTIEEHNPIVKTSFKPTEAKRLACVNYELLTRSIAKAGELGSFFRLLMDEDLLLMFDEDLNNASPKNRKMARLFITLAENILSFKEYCNTIVEIAAFQNKILLRYKAENPFVDLIERNQSLEAILSDLEIDQNQLLTEIKPYNNPIELFVNFAIEFHNTLDKDNLQSDEKEFLLKMQNALKDFFVSYQKRQIDKNIEFYNKIYKLIQL